MAWRLSDVLPNIISISMNPHGSNNALHASMLDLADAISHARPLPPTESKEEWLLKRASAKRVKRPSQHGKDKRSSVNDEDGLCDLPVTVPDLPISYLVRDADLAGLKIALSQNKRKILACGMGQC